MAQRYLAPPSYEPTESGYDERPEEVDRAAKVIATSDRLQLYIFERIARIHPTYLEPFGQYPRDPRLWWSRSPKGARTTVLIRLLNHSVIQFRIIFDTKHVVNVQIPLDSWCRHTCDSESVRAAIQQAWLNASRGEATSPAIVNPNHEWLTVMSHEAYNDKFRRPSYASAPPPPPPLLTRRPAYNDSSYHQPPVGVPPLPRYRRAGSSRSSDYQTTTTHYYSSDDYRSSGHSSSLQPRRQYSQKKKTFFQRLVSW